MGNRILKEKYGEDAFSKQLYNYHPLEHFLAINDVRIRAEKDAPVDVWTWPEQLVPIIGPRLQPDAYFRAMHEGVRSGYFLELQRALKTHTVLLSKCARYQALFASEQFIHRPMTVLVVFTTEYNRTGEQRVMHAVKATPTTYAFIRFASLDAVKGLAPGQFYSAPIWFQPGSAQPESLVR